MACVRLSKIVSYFILSGLHAVHVKMYKYLFGLITSNARKAVARCGADLWCMSRALEEASDELRSTGYAYNEYNTHAQMHLLHPGLRARMPYMSHTSSSSVLHSFTSSWRMIVLTQWLSCSGTIVELVALVVAAVCRRHL